MNPPHFSSGIKTSSSPVPQVPLYTNSPPWNYYDQSLIAHQSGELQYSDHVALPPSQSHPSLQPLSIPPADLRSFQPVTPQSQLTSITPPFTSSPLSPTSPVSDSGRMGSSRTQRARGRQVPTAKDALLRSGATSRSYPCYVQDCGKVFTRAEHMKRHVKSIHTNERPFVCDEPDCGKTFTRNDNLLQHRRSHKRPLLSHTQLLTNASGPLTRVHHYREHPQPGLPSQNSSMSTILPSPLTTSPLPSAYTRGYTVGIENYVASSLPDADMSFQRPPDNMMAPRQGYVSPIPLPYVPYPEQADYVHRHHHLHIHHPQYIPQQTQEPVYYPQQYQHQQQIPQFGNFVETPVHDLLSGPTTPSASSHRSDQVSSPY